MNLRRLIFGGHAAPRYDFFARGVLPICGATLIHPDILITAAHCAKYFSEGMTFYIGATALNGSDVLDSIEIETIRIHPDYVSGTLTPVHDIALLKLRRQSKVSPVAWNMDPNGISPGDIVTVIGLGDDENGNAPDHLMEAEVEIIDSESCSLIYSAYGGIDNETQICAGSLGAGICLRDSGGPLLYKDNLIGIVSFGLVEPGGSCSIDGSTIYTRISGYNDFIERGICELSNVPPDLCFGSIVSSTGEADPSSNSVLRHDVFFPFMLLSSALFA